MRVASYRRAVIAAATVLLLLAGCAGGNVTPPMLSASSPQNASRRSAPDERVSARLTIRVRIPRRHHRVRYISPATKSMTLVFIGPVNRVKIIGLTASSRGCSTSGQAVSCTISETFPSGKYVANIATYDLAPVNGNIPGGAKLLSTASNVFFKVKQGKKNELEFVLGGIVKTIAIGALPNASVGTAFTSPQSFSVTAKDPDGYTIVGPYATPMTLTDSDSSGATSLATSGSDRPPSGVLTSSSDTATLSYTGVPIAAPPSIGATASGASPASRTFTPAAAPVPALAGASNSAIVAGTTAAETFKGSGFLQVGTTVSVSGSGVSVKNVHVQSATSMTANVVVAGATPSGTFTLSVTTPGGTTQPLTLGIATRTSVVTLNTDANAGTNGQGAGNAGDLRYAILDANANPGTLITFNCGSPCTIALQGPLPPITANANIDGGTYGDVVIDGGSTYRAFFVDKGDVVLANLEIANVRAAGGQGGGSNGGAGNGGGGGAGLGAGLFVNKSSAHVSVLSDYFNVAVAVGGAGGAGQPTGTATASGGGGGLFGNGGSATGSNSSGGGGGGGVLANGADASGSHGGDGGAGGGGGAGGPGGDGSGGSGYASNSGGDSGGYGAPGNGGFGGGGGGGQYSSGPGANGGTFGGGGGGAGGGGNAGKGGAGGGGGGSYAAGGGSPGDGGALATLAGGNGDGAGHAGGGAAAGPAIFVNAGTLTTTNSGATGCTATGGTASGGNAKDGTADSTPVFNYAGTVNASTTTGPVAGALSNSQPAIARGRKYRVGAGAPTRE